ncbi:hypothetical protein HPP92_011669 [Vanilla planifolia]|uniref:Uncharacterized protein n=1 Tax=Vanilla planifolia TaxID=51239 RepID=A0A835R8X1_VANPL|nr:hypothetical protein HPP92_011669 [Vanilla planifolia]
MVRGQTSPITPDTPSGNDSSYAYFKRIVDIHPIDPPPAALSFADIGRGRFWGCSSHSSTLTSSTRPVRSTPWRVSPDSSTTRASSRGGTSPSCPTLRPSSGSLYWDVSVTAFIESSAGIREVVGQGLTALTTAAWFVLSLFFTPLLASIPPWAVGPGYGSRRGDDDEGRRRRWCGGHGAETIPAFLTLILVPAHLFHCLWPHCRYRLLRSPKRFRLGRLRHSQPSRWQDKTRWMPK